MKVTITSIDIFIWLIFSCLAIYITKREEFIFVALGGLLFFTLIDFKESTLALVTLIRKTK